ncbi:unnamed protein product [Effrenium voratum]|uniref:Uncharacterized protein n=1 Tax=Effrenium voratum TaxID=2562239 RepID=A0AA36JJP4_9DINO|nr:unnamed protein product [Effrenium voratum]CAJ1448474.1 unnamed protein product [Effrenium voratum]
MDMAMTSALVLFYLMNAVICGFVQHQGTGTWISCVMLWAMWCWVAFLTWYTWDAWACWRKFMQHRKLRSSPDSPSHKRRPNLEHRPRSSIPLPAEEEITKLARLLCAKNEVTRPRTYKRLGSAVSQLSLGSLDSNIAGQLDMDHVHLSFEPFLWGRVFIGLGAWVSMIFGGKDTPGVLRYGLMQLLRRLGLCCKVQDPAKTCAELLLETTLAIYVQSVTADPTIDAIAKFVIPDVPHFAEKGAKLVHKDLVATVHLSCRRLMSASFGGLTLSADEAMVLLNMACAYLVHPMIHAFGNWATDPDSGNPVVRRNSIATVLYNYYGVNAFGHWCDLMCLLGFGNVDAQRFKTMLESVLKQHVPPHPQVKALMPHSKLVSFTVHIRRKFLQLFEHYQHDFPGIDGEALFLATVVHPLDHFNLITLQHVMDMVCMNPEYDEDLLVVRSAIMMTSEKLWVTYLAYDFGFAASEHSLFREIYQKAASINKQFADQLECCVMR